MKYRILAAIAVSVFASACNRKPEGQTVAVVNGDEITAPDLNFALDQAKVPESADKNAARAQVLEQLVDKRLLARPTATLSLEAQQRRELKQKMFGD